MTTDVAAMVIVLPNGRVNRTSPIDTSPLCRRHFCDFMFGGAMRTFTPRSSRTLNCPSNLIGHDHPNKTGKRHALDPPKCRRFGDRIMRSLDRRRAIGRRTGFHFCGSCAGMTGFNSGQGPRSGEGGNDKKGSYGCFRGSLISTRPLPVRGDGDPGRAVRARPVLGERSFRRGQPRRGPQMVQSRRAEGTRGCDLDAPRGRRDDVGCRNRDRAARSPCVDDRALRLRAAGVTPAARHWQGSISWLSCRSRRGMDRYVRRDARDS